MSQQVDNYEKLVIENVTVNYKKAPVNTVGTINIKNHSLKTGIR